LLTRATAVCAGIFMLTSVSLAYLSSSGDRALKTKLQQVQQQSKSKGTEGEKRAPTASSSAKTEGDKPAEAPAPAAPASSTPQ
jgi:preprotein translocase subunit SecG